MKKVLVVGIIILFIGLAVIPSINANDSIIPVKSKLVDTSIKIYRDRGITPFTLKLTEKQSDEISRIFDNLKVSLDSAVTGEEIDEIYDDAVESLYELGLFPRMTLKEAKQLITSEENFNCRIAGETTRTFIWDLGISFWNKILELFRWQTLGWREYNFPYYKGEIGFISFGEYHIDDYGWDKYYPCKGWVWTNGTNGVIKWSGNFRGGLGYREVYYDGHFGTGVDVYKGVKNFKGIFVDKWGEPPCYLGNAEHVKIIYDAP
jgi:hypothetical protein